MEEGPDAGTSGPEEISPRQRSLVLLTVTLAAFLNPFTASSINLALPVIAEEFSIDALTLSWVPGAYLLASIIFLIPAGQLGDAIGRMRIFRVGTVVYTVASLLVVFTPFTLFLLICRFLQGIGGAMVFSSVTAIIADLYPPGERGRALGINVMVIYMGLFLGPFLGGILTEYFGWRSIFMVTFAVAGAAIALFGQLPDDRHREHEPTFPFNALGAIIFGSALFAFYIGFSSEDAAAKVLLSALAAIFMAAFFLEERRARSPLLPLRLFSENRLFAFSNIAALINYSATYAVSLLLSLYLQYIRGLTAGNAGLILLVQPLVQMLVSPVAGRISDRRHPAKIATTGLMISAVCLLILTFLSDDTLLEFLLLVLILLGIGLAFFSAPNTNAVMSSVERRDYGVASATVATMRALGMTLSMGIVMFSFTVFIGSTEISPHVYPMLLQSIRLVFGVCTVLSLSGAALFIVHEGQPKSE